MFDFQNISVRVVNDEIPETNETFVFTLVSAIPMNNDTGSSAHSSATISHARSCNVTILTNDAINGLFQITATRPPNGTFVQSRHVVGKQEIEEESSTLELYVVRTQGTKGIMENLFIQTFIFKLLYSTTLNG